MKIQKVLSIKKINKFVYINRKLLSSEDTLESEDNLQTGRSYVQHMQLMENVHQNTRKRVQIGQKIPNRKMDKRQEKYVQSFHRKRSM